MEIYLLRHGASTSNEQRLVCGAADYPLSATGLTQANRVCDYLSRVPFTRIYSSPLVRARQTIAQLATRVEVSIESALVELNTGEASNISVDELWAREPRYRYQGLNPDLYYPFGECLNDMLGRVNRWYERVSREWLANDIVLISGHEGTVCGILHSLLRLDVAHYPTFLIGNGDHVHITINEDNQMRCRFVPLSSLA